LRVGRVEEELRSKAKERALHFSLIDPDKTGPSDAGSIASKLEAMGTDAILVGGSIGVSERELDEVIIEIKRSCSLPVILFPGNITGISRYADAILFMSLLNSTNPYFITRAQLLGAAIIRKYDIEAIPTGYIIVGSGGAAGYVGYAHGVPYDRADIGGLYVLLAKYMGMRFAYLEAGSGAPRPVPPTMVRAARNLAGEDIVIMVGGGIRDGETAASIVKAGANIIVTGTLIERNPDKVSNIIRAVKSVTRHSS